AERRAGPLRRPRVREVPADLLRALLVEQHDRAVASFGATFDDRESPLPELVGIRDTALQRNRREGIEARQLSDVRRIVAFAVVDCGSRRVETAAFLKACLRDTVDLHQKVEAAVRI